MPIMLETSLQAQFVIPMAISLSFGILFATVITLFLIPSLYLLQQDFGRGFSAMKDLLLGRDPGLTTDAEPLAEGPNSMTLKSGD